MASKFAKMKVNVQLGAEFNDYVENLFFDYLKESQEKWGFSLSETQIDSVYVNSYAQLRRKVEEVFKTELGSLPLQSADDDDEYGDPDGVVEPSDDAYGPVEEMQALDVPDLSRIVVEVKSEFHTPGSEVAVMVKNSQVHTADGEPSSGDLILLRTSSGYTVTDELGQDTVWLSVFDKEVARLITKWTDTAVFYSVASFS